MTLVSYFHVTIDTDGRSPDQGDLLEVLVEAAPFGSAAACRDAFLDAYRPTFPHVAVTVAEAPVLGPKLTVGVHDARAQAGRP